ncbi:UNVERIFIED_CONTAM: hypothetical protein Sradi_1912900 [Sesamum radiatum]|uniref:Uncharacterized protein n=1 Tax=Sesamum radiatum TaxID=300843 RepID=A0AAW2TZQ0_SESRA
MLQPAREVALITWSQQAAVRSKLARLVIGDLSRLLFKQAASSLSLQRPATCDLPPAIH